MTEATSEVMKPGEEVFRPQVSLKTAASLVERLYKFKVKEVKELVSYDDRNFKVLVEDIHDNPYVTELHPHGYTLKILNSRDSPNHHVEAEHAMIKVLVKNGINTIQPVLNIHGKDLSRERLFIEAEEEIQVEKERPSAIYVVRLMTFVAGQTLHTVPYTPVILYESGCLLGKLTKALENFSHPVFTKFETIWSLKNVSDLRDFVFAVKDENNKKIVLEVIEAFEKEVLPNFSQFRKGVIHSDFHDENIIIIESNEDQRLAKNSISSRGISSVENGPLTPSKTVDYRNKCGTCIYDDNHAQYKISGLIDLGDAVYSPLVEEIATAIMYFGFISLEVNLTHVKAMDAPGFLLAGFEKYFILTENEWHSLKLFVVAKYVQHYVFCEHSRIIQPGNDYACGDGWNSDIEQFWYTPKEKIYERWKSVMDTYSARQQLG